MAGLVLDERWDAQVEEFGAINMTGLRIVQYNTPLARDFFPRCPRLCPPPSFPLPRFAQFTLDQAKRSRAPPSSPLPGTISAGGALAFDTVNLLINTFSSLVRKESRLFKEGRKGKPGRDPVKCGDLSGGDKPTR
jgi:hypothetical protein